VSEDLNDYLVDEPKGLTLEALTDACKTLADIREAKRKLEDEIKKYDERQKGLEAKVLEYLTQYGLPSFKFSGGTVSVTNRKSVKQPETLEDKAKFFDYLKDQGVFMELVSVNSRTLTSWASKEIEARETQGEYGFEIPGLKAPEIFKTISLRKA
jgi:transcriptional regulator of heat shock response